VVGNEKSRSFDLVGALCLEPLRRQGKHPIILIFRNTIDSSHNRTPFLSVIKDGLLSISIM
jgi:hypothetical protein